MKQPFLKANEEQRRAAKIRSKEEKYVNKQQVIQIGIQCEDTKQKDFML
jgi:hypothetical protein